MLPCLSIVLQNGKTDVVKDDDMMKVGNFAVDYRHIARVEMSACELCCITLNGINVQSVFPCYNEHQLVRFSQMFQNLNHTCECRYTETPHPYTPTLISANTKKMSSTDVPVHSMHFRHYHTPPWWCENNKEVVVQHGSHVTDVHQRQRRTCC